MVTIIYIRVELFFLKKKSPNGSIIPTYRPNYIIGKVKGKNTNFFYDLSLLLMISFKIYHLRCKIKTFHTISLESFLC